jgi:tellurium resistance protein TerD
MSDDEDFSKFLESLEDDKVKPIDAAKPLAPSPPPASPGQAPDVDDFRAKAERAALKMTGPPGGQDSFKTKMPPPHKEAAPLSDDPIVLQRQREEQEEETRKQRIRARNKDIPEHLVDQVLDQDEANFIKKGDHVDLLQKVPSLRSLYIGAGWEVKTLDAEGIDIDLSLFLLNKNDTTREDGDFVFYNQLIALEGAVRHDGDNRQGAGEGDIESCTIDLNGIPYDVVKIMMVLTIYDEVEHGLHFGQVRNIHLRLVDKEYGEEICRLKIDEDELKEKSGVYMGALVREGPRWFFHVIGDSIGRGGLGIAATRYGILIKELQSTG